MAYRGTDAACPCASSGRGAQVPALGAAEHFSPGPCLVWGPPPAPHHTAALMHVCSHVSQLYQALCPKARWKQESYSKV